MWPGLGLMLGSEALCWKVVSIGTAVVVMWPGLGLILGSEALCWKVVSIELEVSVYFLCMFFTVNCIMTVEGHVMDMPPTVLKMLFRGSHGRCCDASVDKTL